MCDCTKKDDEMKRVIMSNRFLRVALIVSIVADVIIHFTK